MPNMLAHFGVQGFLTRSLLPKADFKIIFLGCLLPDVPWIFHRFLQSLAPPFDPYTVQVYATVQASLFMTILLCGSLAVLSRCPGTVFAVLALNSVFHLILDSLQTKWGNGVHLFAPVSWKLLNFGLFWPESLPTYALTIFGLGYMAWAWKPAMREPLVLLESTYKRYLLSGGMLVLYFSLPLLLLHGPFMANNHYVKTLQLKTARVGENVEFDRKYYSKGPQGDVIKLYGGEELHVSGRQLEESGSVSVRARFVKPDTIEILEFHEHSRLFRDGSTYIGLVLLITMWAVAYRRIWGSRHAMSVSRHDPNK